MITLEMYITKIKLRDRNDYILSLVIKNYLGITYSCMHIFIKKRCLNMRYIINL